MSYTGPVRPTNEDWDKFYHRAKDFLNPLQQRGWGVAINPNDHAMIKDLFERLIEDDTWQHGKKTPRILVSITVKRGDIMPVDPKTMEIATMRQAMQSSTGFGRFRGLTVPSGMHGLHNPWRRQDHG